jgi:hypothetical protein
MIETDKLAAVDRIIAPNSRSAQEEALERALRPRRLADYTGQVKIREQLEIFIQAARKRQRFARPRAAFRPAGAGQDDAGPHRRPRDGRQPAPDLGPGARTRRRPRRHPDQPRTARRAVHRRDPPPQPVRRGDPLPGAGGLPDRHHDRRRPSGSLDQARPAAVHAGWRHHPRGTPDLPLRDRFGIVARLEFYRWRICPHRGALGADAEDRHRCQRRGWKSPAVRAARRASPTGCCVAYATTPRSRQTARSPTTLPIAHWIC